MQRVITTSFENGVQFFILQINTNYREVRILNDLLIK